MLIEEIFQDTEQYIESVSKSERKEIGQFFTDIDTARYMAASINPTDNKFRMLDPGCGSAILSAAAIEQLANIHYQGHIILDLYENNKAIYKLLHQNIELIKNFCNRNNINITIHLKKKNFITENCNIWYNIQPGQIYDYVICNPPYKKIGKSDLEAKVMNNIVYGQPNIYFLFMAMATKLTKDNGSLVFITPRSWTSGAYFASFREYFLQNVSVEAITLFVSRGDVFNSEPILQETMIMQCTKNTIQTQNIRIVTVESAQDFNNTQTYTIQSADCIDLSDRHYVIIPVRTEERNALASVSKYTETILSLGYKLKTGPVVEFRQTEKLRKTHVKHSIPLLQSCNLIDGTVQHVRNSKKIHYYVPATNDSNILKIENMLLIKRLTSKEENRRLQVAVLNQNQVGYDLFTIENHVNYMIGTDQSLSEEELYGLYVLFSSSIYDNYYRALNGSTQVNADEINNMPMPSKDRIIELGRQYLQGKRAFEGEL